MSNPQPLQERPTLTPNVDIYENDKEFLILADLPGVAQPALAVRLEQQELTIEARFSPPWDEQSLALEFKPLDFKRTFTVPRNINADGVHAELKHGVLAVHLPKLSALKPREVPIRLA